MPNEHLHRTLADLRPGDHLCCLYNSDSDHRAVTTTFLRQGLERGEKVAYAFSSSTPETILGFLRTGGVEVEPFLASGQLEVFAFQRLLASGGGSGPEDLVAGLETETAKALAAGYQAWRVCLEMPAERQDAAGPGTFMEYGVRLNEFCDNHPCIIVCQYDRRRFAPAVLLEILASHPVAIVGTEVLDNIYYLPPKEVLGPELAAAKLSLWLDKLMERKRAVEALRRQTQRLGERVKELNCLYEISRLLGKPGLSPEEVLQGIMERIPSAWQYPDITGARITLAGREVKTANFADTPWKLSRDIVMHGQPAGALEVIYREERPLAAEGPFLKEECNLLDAIARLLGRFADRVRAEEALRQSELQYRTLVEQIPAITYTAALDETSTTLYISPQAEAILGFSDTDYQADPDIWKKQLHPEDRDRVLGEVALAHASGKPFASEYRMLTKDGRILWFRDEAWVVRDEGGRPLFLQGVMLDITERRRAEEERQHYHEKLEKLVDERTAELKKAIVRLYEEIQERRAMEKAVERSAEKIKIFAYSIIHDLKNPAVGLHGLANLLKRQYQDILDDRGKQYCEQIVGAAEQINNLVKRINSYIVTKEVPLTLKTIHLPEILQIVREEFAEQLHRRGIIWSEPENPPDFAGDGLYILRALRNLVDNALKYGGEQLSRISIGCEDQADSIVLSVQDDGVGISLKDPEKLFGIFKRYETSLNIEGTGLGLAIVKEIAEKHGGTVWMESSPQQGATFFISIAK